MKYFFVFLLLVQSFYTAKAQHNIVAQKDSINNQLEILGTFPQTLYNDQLSFDPDSLSSIIADNIIKYTQSVGFENFNVDDFSGIELNNDSSNYPFSVVSFGYDSGGTARTIPTSIIVKKEKERYSYYNMTGYEADFYEIHQLRDNLYLCFATVPGWGMCANSAVFAFELNQDKAVERPVFNGKAKMSFCFSNYKYHEQSRILTIDIDDTPLYDEGKNYKAYFEKQGLNFFKIEPAEISDTDFSGILTSKFDGQKLVKP